MLWSQQFHIKWILTLIFVSQVEIQSPSNLSFTNNAASLVTARSAAGTYLAPADFSGQGVFLVKASPTVSPSGFCGMFASGPLLLAVVVLSLDSTVRHLPLAITSSSPYKNARTQDALCLPCCEDYIVLEFSWKGEMFLSCCPDCWSITAMCVNN